MKSAKSVEAKNQVVAIFVVKGAIVAELKQRNDLHGGRGSRRKQQLTYFL
ncbi:hypothetical protein SLEP1_g58611 [Rubroshorea leprosula]|uniref:Uncharacterized protein n=1 Tax=Rubroshorea leprosula TaxID=152421 RepID=A0AAV5MTG1_9ROSI|nr:hypothetical protein SLEP1_g58611 [Rubroshorea leprosula]